MSKSLYRSEHNEMWTSDRATPYPCLNPSHHDFKDGQEYTKGVDYELKLIDRQVQVEGHLECALFLTAVPIIKYKPEMRELIEWLHEQGQYLNDTITINKILNKATELLKKEHEIKKEFVPKNVPKVKNPDGTDHVQWG